MSKRKQRYFVISERLFDKGLVHNPNISYKELSDSSYKMVNEEEYNSII